jgi:hypothetical protein
MAKHLPSVQVKSGYEPSTVAMSVNKDVSAPLSGAMTWAFIKLDGDDDQPPVSVVKTGLVLLSNKVSATRCGAQP